MIVFYQPIVELPGRELVRAEALCRFPPAAGLQTPDDYIRHAEKEGLVRGVTDWVMAQALGFWRRLGPAAPKQLAINISPKNLLEADLSERIFTALAKSGIEASRLWLEIDERLLLARDTVSQHNIKKLVDAGVHLGIDSFGPSLSAVSHLQLPTFPLSELKVDRSYFSDLNVVPERRAKLKTIADVAAECGLDLAAKGVEDEATVEWLLHFGYVRMQGYIVAAPMGEAEFQAWLARQRPSTAA